MKKLMLVCLVAVSTAMLSFTAFAPAIQNSVAGCVYDQSDNSLISEIVVEEIVNNVAISSTVTDATGHFSLTVKNSKPILRFSDPNYNSYTTQTQQYDLSQDCSNVSVYMSQK